MRRKLLLLALACLIVLPACGRKLPPEPPGPQAPGTLGSIKALKDGRLDAARCLSYWTTQAKWRIPGEAAQRRQDWAYGCDLCQEACPQNKAPGQPAPGFEPKP